MKLLEAFQIVNQGVSTTTGPPFRAWLVCGFTPLHLGTFLHAHLKCSLPGREVRLETGQFGDVPGNLKRAQESKPDGIAVALEWQDLDQRLGVRQLGGWGPGFTKDIVDTSLSRLDYLAGGIAAAAAVAPVALCPPTLPLPPFSHEARWQSGPAELSLRAGLSAFLTRVADLKSVRVVSTQMLDLDSPCAGRFDLKADLSNGFPFSVSHAERVGALLARSFSSAPRKKGLITDLDDTFWRGILGEAGVEGVTWDLANKSHMHGVYQQLLASLASAGVLIAAASKNDPALVAEAFRQRSDLLAPASCLFPIEAGWNRKSESVGRILDRWNIGADSVVFVDDSPLELEEVRSAYPQIETLRFPTDDPAAWEMIGQLQDLFGKPALQDEDRLRVSSIRAAEGFVETRTGGPSEDEFLRQVNATVTIEAANSTADSRPLELINKTNQFNLNGRRIGEAEWRTRRDDPAGLVLVVSYQDKFGPLGKIAVLSGRRESDGIHLSSWVMSCRAFARRIEHQCLRRLFDLAGCQQVTLDYQSTPRNGPLREFLAEFADLGGDGPVRITRAAFNGKCPLLFHTVREASDE